MTKSTMSVSFADIERAAVTIAPHVHRTPVLSSGSMDAEFGFSGFFKCENFQVIGAFKARGASNAIFVLDEKQAMNGVATHSSGNHGAALARAAQLRGIPCTVVVPRGANQGKLAAIRRYGADIIECEPTQAGREATLAEFVERHSATVVHPYQSPAVIAGQGTVSREFLEQCPDIEVLLVPLGGGGLLSGTVVHCRTRKPELAVIGVEPAGAADGVLSMQRGEVTSIGQPETIADGLRATIGDINFRLIRDGVERIETVSDAEIVAAMRMIYERLKIVVEPSAAVVLAAAIRNREIFAGKRIGMILSGGNVDLEQLPWIQLPLNQDR